ncbi:MAG: alpha/beta hydrolase fold domain-containing protein [Luteolibacter sp.]
MKSRIVLSLLTPFLMASALLGEVAGEALLTLPIRFHLTEGAQMNLKGQAMDMWVTPEDIERRVLPEVNRIWRQANIQFVIERCESESLLSPLDRDALIRSVEQSKRGDTEDRETGRIASITKLLDPAQRHPTALNVYLLPFIGSTYQGYATLGGKHAVIGVWSDKASNGKKPPVKALLVEPEPMKVGSLARTIAHELGHNLGLKHPPKDLPNPTPRLMGGRIQGYELTAAEIKKARAIARKHGATKGSLAIAQESQPRKVTQNTKPVLSAAEQAKRMIDCFPEFEHTTNIVYKTVSGQALQLDLLTPKGLKSEAAPLLVYVHGGGWRAGNRYNCMKPDVSGIFRRCAAAGILCATIEYRLISPQSTAFDSATDCFDALRFLVKNAGKYRIDPERIGTIGGSAGGHLSLVIALGDPKNYPGDPALADFDPKQLRCEIAHYPATDFTDVSLARPFIGPSHEVLMFGGPAEQKADIIRLLSPVHLIKKESTPVYCFHGDKDPTLPVENSRRLFAAGKKVGADIQYTEVAGGVHGFDDSGVPKLDEIVAKASDFVIERLSR